MDILDIKEKEHLALVGMSLVIGLGALAFSALLYPSYLIDKKVSDDIISPYLAGKISQETASLLLDKIIVDDETARDVVNKLIKEGNAGTEVLLIHILNYCTDTNRCGKNIDGNIAYIFINSNNTMLELEGKKWASNHGFQVTETTTSVAPPKWGQ